MDKMDNNTIEKIILMLYDRMNSATAMVRVESEKMRRGNDETEDIHELLIARTSYVRIIEELSFRQDECYAIIKLLEGYIKEENKNE